jgi:hypothetical protein
VIFARHVGHAGRFLFEEKFTQGAKEAKKSILLCFLCAFA